MTFRDELLGVLMTLNTQRLRAVLTLLGIILGVGTLVVLSSALASSGKYMQRGMQQASGEDVITLSKRWQDEHSHKTAFSLNRFDSRALAEDPALSGSQVLNLYSMRVPWGDRWGQTIYVVGTVPAALSFYDLEVAKGRFVSQADGFDHAKVAVLGSEALAHLLGPGAEGPGSEIKLKGERFRVIGVLKPKPKMGQGNFRTWNGSVIVPESTYVDRFAPSKDIQEIVVKAAPDVLARLGLAPVISTIEALVLSRHHGVHNFDLGDPLKNSQSTQVIRIIVDGLEAAIAFVCLGVGGINVMNILLVSVTQRTREIGIRRALGATKASIRRQFLTEAAILACLGGLLGVVGGVVVAYLLSVILTLTLGFWPFVFMPVQAGLGFGFALITGLVFGWYPAHKAANLSPIDCLRYE